MPSSKDYNKGYQDGYWFGQDSAYERGYEEGKQAECRRHKQGQNLAEPQPSTLASMVGGSIILTLLGWSFAGLILLLLWISGNSGGFLFKVVFYGALWIGLGFIAITSIGGVIMTIVEHQKAKNPPQKPVDDPNLPFYKKYPPADVLKAREANKEK